MISAVQTQRGNDHRELGVFAKTRWEHVTQSPVKTWSVTHLMTDFPPRARYQVDQCRNTFRDSSIQVQRWGG